MDTDSTDGAMKRRTVLRATGAALAAGTGLAAVGTASADSHCYYETECLELICPSPDGGGLTKVRRECCEQPDGTVECTSEFVGCCSDPY